jgi:hypothetical protein
LTGESGGCLRLAEVLLALDGAVKTVNRELEAKARDLAGLKPDLGQDSAVTDGAAR